MLPTGPGVLNARVTDRYRQGRVFLAGDAAHVHSAMGAPGSTWGAGKKRVMSPKRAARQPEASPKPALILCEIRVRKLCFTTSRLSRL
ncbi:FAD-dependent monooxygenase [Nonomuraea polychroma]|uniref:FAD-dependent monooxygenase n=1 Tax=Nonomuraea polychroma TaxID=46176 RepID=UPI000FDEF1E4|nr:FAD-dependent monooxygenase [Nonomuraea polychroma]